MDELLRQLSAEPLVPGFTFGEFLLSIFLSAALAMVMAIVYRQTHTGLSYSRSFVMSMVLMAVTISFIMLIIGSNLARAFSLVGALSIVRYRNAVKDSRDTAFIFLVMAIGMASGTRLYGMAVVFTAATAVLILVLDKISFGSVGGEERLLQFAFAPSAGISARLEEKLRETSSGNFTLLSSELVGDRKVLVYSAELPKRGARDEVLDKFREDFEDLDVKMLTGFEKFNI